MDREWAGGTGAVCVEEEGTTPDDITLGITNKSSSQHQISEGRDKSLQLKINWEIKKGEGKDKVRAFFFDPAI